MRRLRLLGTLLLAVALPASAGAATILGGPRSDTVRGTARADLVDVVGGGRDRVSCGSGSDTVVADASDRVASDCETVARRIAVDASHGPGAHATIVEPSAAANGSTVVAVFQEGRRSEGTDAIGFATSGDGGATWRSGVLPVTGAGGWAVASDPVVAWDAAHHVFVATALAFRAGLGAIVATASSDGLAWSPAVPVVQQTFGDAAEVPLDKEWIACGAGTCVVAATSAPDTISARIALWTSTDGGATWSPGASAPHGYFAQPAVLADGTVVVVYLDLARHELVAATSTDGGASFAATADISPALRGAGEEDLRAPSLPSLALGRDGELDVAWPSCADALCAHAAIRFSRSTDGGATWSAPRSLALGPGLHLVAALATDPATGRLALTDYVDTGDACCALVAQVASSTDGGTTWTVRRASARPLRRAWLAPAKGGSFVGDYVATVFSGRRAVSVFPLAEPPLRGRLREDLFAVRS